MEQKISPSKSAIQLGILFGIVMILEFVLLYILDIDPITNPSVGIIVSIFNYLIFPVSIITYGCIDYKNKHGLRYGK